MSALGQKRTSLEVQAMSALPPKADIILVHLMSVQRIKQDAPDYFRPTVARSSRARQRHHVVVGSLAFDD